MSKCGLDAEDGRRILMAVDESEHSLRVFDFYKSGIRKEKDELTILHVYQPPTMSGVSLIAVPSSYISGPYFTEIEKSLENARSLLLRFKDLSEENKIKNVSILKASEGNIGKTICSTAAELKPTLIMVGSRGLGAVSRFILGSVSDYVIHHAESTVCVVPKP